MKSIVPGILEALRHGARRSPAAGRSRRSASPCARPPR
jgi:hypothetical protein